MGNWSWAKTEELRKWREDNEENIIATKRRIEQDSCNLAFLENEIKDFDRELNKRDD